MLRRSLPNRAPIRVVKLRHRLTRVGKQEKATSMTEQEQRRASEREEIAARVARFRATQEKFRREREEYFITTLQNARAIKPIRF